MAGFSIEINWENSNLGDWPLVMRLKNGLTPEDLDAWLELIDRIVVGGRKAFPMPALRDVMAAIGEDLARRTNPKAPTA